MLDLCRLIFAIASDLLRSRVALEAEILVLRQQINVLRRGNPKRLRFVSIDRLILGSVCRLFPKMYGALAIVCLSEIKLAHTDDEVRREMASAQCDQQH